MKRILPLILLALTAFTACIKEEVTPDDPEYEHLFLYGKWQKYSSASSSYVYTFKEDETYFYEIFGQTFKSEVTGTFVYSGDSLYLHSQESRIKYNQDTTWSYNPTGKRAFHIDVDLNEMTLISQVSTSVFVDEFERVQ